MIAVGFTNSRRDGVEHPYRWSPCPEASASYVAARIQLEGMHAAAVAGPKDGYFYLGRSQHEQFRIYAVVVPDLPHPACCEIQQRWCK